MQKLINEMEALLATWDEQAKNLDLCDMPASARALRECQQRLGLVLAMHAPSPIAHQSEGNLVI